MDFLYGSRISNTEDLTAMKNQLQMQFNVLIAQRKRLYTHKKNAVKDNNGYEINNYKQEMQETSRKIREIRKKLKLCDKVFITSDRVLKNVDAPTVKPEEPKINKKGKVRIR
jgi:seryl-tRNA synthetase